MHACPSLLDSKTRPDPLLYQDRYLYIILMQHHCSLVPRLSLSLSPVMHQYNLLLIWRQGRKKFVKRLTNFFLSCLQNKKARERRPGNEASIVVQAECIIVDLFVQSGGRMYLFVHSSGPFCTF